MKKISKFNIFGLIFGGTLTIAGIFLLVSYYDLKQTCVINKVPCPNFSSYSSLGAPLLVIGLVLLIVISIAWIGITKETIQIPKGTK